MFLTSFFAALIFFWLLHRNDCRFSNSHASYYPPPPTLWYPYICLSFCTISCISRTHFQITRVILRHSPTEHTRAGGVSSLRVSIACPPMGTSSIIPSDRTRKGSHAVVNHWFFFLRPSPSIMKRHKNIKPTKKSYQMRTHWRLENRVSPFDATGQLCSHLNPPLLLPPVEACDQMFDSNTSSFLKLLKIRVNATLQVVPIKAAATTA